MQIVKTRLYLCHASALLAGIQYFLRFLDATSHKKRAAGMTIVLVSCFFVSTAYATTHSIIKITEKNCPTPKLFDFLDGAKQLNCRSYHQTTNYTCGPAAVMSLMHYYGMLSDKEMNQVTELRIAREMQTEESSGTTQSQMETWLRDHGFKVVSGQRVTTAMLMSNIDQGIPIIVATAKHWTLAKGYNPINSITQENTGEIIFADSCCGTRIIPGDIIDTMWLASKMPSNHFVGSPGFYIIAVPIT